MVKPWQMKPSPTSPATSVISGPTPARKMRGVPVRVRAGVEERRHQRVLVELAAEVELRARVPAVPDRADREDHLAHPRRGVAPRHREALLDVRLDLRAEPEDEAAASRTPGGRSRCSRAASGCARTRPRCSCRARCARCARPRGAAGRTGRDWSPRSRCRRSQPPRLPLPPCRPCSDRNRCLRQPSWPRTIARTR